MYLERGSDSGTELFEQHPSPYPYSLESTAWRTILHKIFNPNKLGVKILSPKDLAA